MHTLFDSFKTPSKPEGNGGQSAGSSPDGSYNDSPMTSKFEPMAPETSGPANVCNAFQELFGNCRRQQPQVQDKSSIAAPATQYQIDPLVLQCENALGALQSALQEWQLLLHQGDEVHERALVPKAYKNAKSLKVQAELSIGQIKKLPMGHPAKSHIGDLEQHLSHLKGDWSRLEESAKKHMKSLPKENLSDAENQLVSRLDGPAPALHAKLEELRTTLEAVLKATETGDQNPAWERSADAASAAYENFRVQLGAGLPPQERPTGQELLNVLQGFSHWADPREIQKLLHHRSQYLVARFQCGVQFKEHEKDKWQWPQAAPYASLWESAVMQTLGAPGVEDWRKRISEFRGSGTRAQGQMVADKGVLRISSIRAGNLRHADVLDQSDPYVLFEFQTQKKQTEVVWNNETDPKWKNDVVFDVASLRNGPHGAVLRAVVFDYDYFTTDDSLGYAEEPPRHSSQPDIGEGGYGIDILQVFENKHPTMRSDSGSGAAAPAAANSTGCVVHLGGDGSARCTTGKLSLRGANAGAKGSWLEFEVSLEFDPLVVQPLQADQAIMLFADVDPAVQNFQKKYTTYSLGFLVSKQDASNDLNDGAYAQMHPQDHFGKESMKTRLTHGMQSMGHPFSSGAEADQSLAETMQQQVLEYNQALDTLSLMTTRADAMASGMNASGKSGMNASGMNANMTHLAHYTGVLAHGGPFDNMQEAEKHDVADQFLQVLKYIQSIEKRFDDHAKDEHEKAKRRVYAFQDELLPGIGIWSTDRRRKLRDQVYSACLKVGGFHEELARGTWTPWWCQYAACGGCCVVVVILLICGFAWSWTFAGIGLLVLLVLSIVAVAVLYGCGYWTPNVPAFLNNIASGQATSELHTPLDGDGKGKYARVMAP